MLSVVPLNDTSIYSSINTGEKPQSKLWTHADQWWTVIPNNSGTWISRLDGDSWTPILQVSSDRNVKADAKSDGDLAHILLFSGSSSQLASVEYNTVSNSYDFWDLQPNLVDMGLPGGIETATIDIDSQGRMWVAYDQSSSIDVRYSDGLYTNWSESITIASNITSDDISVVTALPNDSVGVMWSNQNTKRFGFRFHVDGTNPGQWSTDEVPASQSALNIGGGMADDHLNVAVASDGTLYAAVKTSYDSSGASKIALLVRRPSGTWDNLYHVDSIGTRPIVILNESEDRLIVAYTESDSGGDIRYRETAIDTISFGSRQTLISGSVNNPTSTKQNFTDEVVVLASGGGTASGALFSFGQVVINQPPQVNAGNNQTITLGSTAVLAGTVSDDGLPTPPGTVTTSWTVSSGPGNVTFGNASSASTTAQFSAAGNYVLRLTANDGQLSAFDQVTVTVQNSSTSTPVTMTFQDGLYPLVSYYGTRDTKLMSNSATTSYGSNAVLEVDGSPDSAALLGWDVSAIPAGSIVTSARLELNITNATSDNYEIYALQRAWDELSATWEQAAAGTPWSTSGGSGSGDHSTTVLGQLAASSTGAYQLALNAAGLAAVQSWVNDPSTNHGLIFQDYDNATNGLDFSSRETSNASQRPKLVVTYEQLGGNTINQPPQVNAGNNQTITLGSTAVLAGTVSDDGLPTPPGTVTTSWTVSSGPGNVTFGNASSASTTAQFSAAGNYVLRLTANDGQLSAFDQVTVTVTVTVNALPSTDAGLVGHWTLDNTSDGTAADSSGLGNEGIVQGNPQAVVGPSGNALQFNGSSDLIQVNDAPTLDSTDQITIATWIRPETNGTQYAIKKGQYDKTDGFELSLSTNGHYFVRFNQATGGNSHRLDSTATYPTDGNTWVHLVATYDGSTIKIYINGVLDATKNSTFSIGANNLALGIGAQDDGLRPLDGALDDVRIYSRSLSDIEVQALYTSV